jgi:hypothetical protein
MDKVRSFRDLEVYKKLVRLHCTMQQPDQDKPIPNRSFINYNIQLTNYKQYTITKSKPMSKSFVSFFCFDHSNIVI